MRLTLYWPGIAGVALVVALTGAAPSRAADTAHAAQARKARLATTYERIGLYAPRVRRSTVMYLRLRLLELREAGLDRARAAIERRLSIDDLLAQPGITQHSHDERAPLQPPH